MTKQDAHVCVGELTTPHGVRGLMRLRTFTEDAGDIFAFPLTDKAGKPVYLSGHGATNDFQIVAVEGVNTREGADALRHTELFVPRSALPATPNDEYYLSDLEGMIAMDETGETVGRVRAVHDFGAGPLLEIALPGREALMLPFTDSFVPTVDIAASRVTIVMPVMVEGEDRAANANDKVDD